ncbi:hypothetical protein RclHR1_03890022 [Rhizophagus clarus]|uniref:Uncharacterized protein n=1 Tax=Rhizophagus clarus TaxID=94130 RepID=A0A2Z6S815_9GLOM|nr:hypothetical protein RclHR1_03890022 [Rhizophagus clarus]
MSHITTHVTFKHKKRKSFLTSSNPHGINNNTELKMTITQNNSLTTMEGITPIPSASTSNSAVITDLINLEVVSLLSEDILITDVTFEYTEYIKFDEKSHFSRNNLMHAPKEDNVITFNAYINLNDIDNYFHNEDKLTYMELLARDLKGFVEVEIVKED